MTNFTSASRSFVNFVNASSTDDEAKLLKAMDACQDKIKGGGRRLLSEQLSLPIDKAPLPVRVGCVYIVIQHTRVYIVQRELVERPASGGEDEDTLANRFTDLITKVVAESSVEGVMRTQAAEDSQQEAEGNKVVIKDKKPPPAAAEGAPAPKEAVIGDEKPFEEAKVPKTPVTRPKDDPNVDFKLGKKEMVALGKALLKNPMIEEELCQMVTILGYDDARCGDAAFLTDRPFA